MAMQKLYAGVKLRETRTRLGLTQKVFAEKLGVSLPYLNQMENNHRPVSAGVLLRLASEFSVDVGALAARVAGRRGCSTPTPAVASCFSSSACTISPASASTTSRWRSPR